MEKLSVINGISAPLMRRNIDTDAIIPGNKLLKVSKTGFGDSLFGNWRYIDTNLTENPDFVLNMPIYRKAIILIAGTNFGCGSSRENAAWALKDFGIRCVIAPSFGPIFYNNCIKNGLLPIVLLENQVEELAEHVTQSNKKMVTVDLQKCEVTSPAGLKYQFTVSQVYRDILLEGLDPIDATLKFEHEITIFEQNDKLKRPWIYQY
ncbi:MAG: 3-isopropylmalate dehydratase small subunit [Smithella sp.]|nr:3-isopropylmalate dehydratase small subunit [Smithella sp.]